MYTHIRTCMPSVLQTRLAAMEKFVTVLKTKRDIIVKVLMWEICKIQPDAGAYFHIYIYIL